MTLEANAKINLTLEVLGTRPDGYHELRSVVMPISLADTLEVSATDDGVISSDSPYPDDLCVKAAKALARRAPAPRRGARISVVKRIPPGGGLGGGSADAAAVLRALNELWELDLPRAALCEVATEVGSDVPSLVHGGCVLMQGRGEIVRDFGEYADFPLVIVNPGVFSSTKEVFAKCTSPVHEDAGIVYNMRSALQSREIGRIAAACVNDLALAACALHPEICKVMEELRRAGVENPAMSGSGSTVFGLVQGVAQGREICALMEAKGWKAWCVHSSVR